MLFRSEFKRQAFRWAADQVKHEFADSTWQAFWKTGVDNRPVGQVARELDLSTGAVYIARSRVLGRLRQRVQELSEDSGLFIGDEGNDVAPRSM